MKKYAQKFDNEVTLLEDHFRGEHEDGVRETPEFMDDNQLIYKIPNPEFNNTQSGYQALPPVRELPASYTEKRRVLWSNIRQSESNFKKHRFIVSLEITTHILKTVGSFFLGPLLAVLAWLLLSISGTDDLLTFALVSFAIGLTTKTIITRVMNFVGEKIADDSTSATASSTPAEQKPSVTVDPKLARSQQLLIVRGSGFRENSYMELQYYGNSVKHGQVFQSSPKGMFVIDLWLQDLQAGNYDLIVKDSDGNYAKDTFTIIINPSDKQISM
jgi:hypothetical protein